MRSPPTGLDTQVSVTTFSTTSNRSRSVEAVGDLAVHHAVDLQLPVGPAQLRHAQRGVDPVEVGVAGDERRQRNAFRLHCRRHRRRGDSTGGSANASRSPDTETCSRDSTAPPTPLSAPAPRKPSVTSDSRRPRSGASASAFAVGPARRRTGPRSAAAAPRRRRRCRRRSARCRTTVAPARDSTAAHPAIPASTIAALPTGNRRVSHRAVTAAIDRDHHQHERPRETACRRCRRSGSPIP